MRIYYHLLKTLLCNIVKDKEDCEEKNVKFRKHIQFEKYCQTKDLFQKPR